MAKKIDPKAKAKRQKIYAAIGGVILLGVLAFQVPRTMKMLNQSSGSSSTSTPAPAATTTTTSGPIAAPSLGGGNATAAAAAPGGDGLSDPASVPVAASGQLLAFGLFRTKDPFVQQLTAKSTTAAAKPLAATGATGATGASGSTAKPTASVVATPPSKGSGTSTATPPPAKAAAPTSAVISVNGSPETIQVGGTFPASQPFFKLVSLTAKSAKIGIAGGTLETGAATVTLTKGKALTLMNTADGTRYVLRLVSVS